MYNIILYNIHGTYRCINHITCKAFAEYIQHRYVVSLYNMCVIILYLIKLFINKPHKYVNMYSIYSASMKNISHVHKFSYIQAQNNQTNMIDQLVVPPSLETGLWNKIRLYMQFCSSFLPFLQYFPLLD